MPTRSRAELTQMLNNLEARLPVFLSEYGPGDALEAFAGEAEVIEDSAALIDRSHVVGRLHKMADALQQDQG